MENIKRKNVFSKLSDTIKRFWDMLGEEDIALDNDNNLTKKELEELAKIIKVQEEFKATVHGPNKFVPKAKVNEGTAKVIAKGKKVEKEERTLGE